MGFLKEFKSFALKGNVMDMAVGVIIGGAFGKIVTSLVNDVIMPPIGLVVGGVDFTILECCVCMMVKIMNKLMKKEEAKPAPAPAPPAPSKE